VIIRVRALLAAWAKWLPWTPSGSAAVAVLMAAEHVTFCPDNVLQGEGCLQDLRRRARRRSGAVVLVELST
jgi:hypothetical protein